MHTADFICRVYKSEDGLTVLPDDIIGNIQLDEYDSLLLPGAMDIRESIEDKDIIDFVRKFDGKIIGAISIAPLLLVKAGLLNGKPFMAGINKYEILEEGFNIITSISYNFVRWALAFAKMIGIDISPKTFGI